MHSCTLPISRFLSFSFNCEDEITVNKVWSNTGLDRLN